MSAHSTYGELIKTTETADLIDAAFALAKEAAAKGKMAKRAETLGAAIAAL